MVVGESKKGWIQWGKLQSAESGCVHWGRRRNDPVSEYVSRVNYMNDEILTRSVDAGSELNAGVWHR